MPLNLPQYDVTRLSIGPSIIYIGSALTTPTTDLGAVTSAEVKVNVELNKFFSGSPAVPHWYHFKNAEVSLSVKGLEWNLDKLRQVTGGYFYSETAGGFITETLYGTFEFVESLSLRLVHQTPSGATLILDIFEAVPGGSVDLRFAANTHEIPYVFYAVTATTDFAGNTLPPNTAFKLVYQKSV